MASYHDCIHLSLIEAGHEWLALIDLDEMFILSDNRVGCPKCSIVIFCNFLQFFTEFQSFSQHWCIFVYCIQFSLNLAAFVSAFSGSVGALRLKRVEFVNDLPDQVKGNQRWDCFVIILRNKLKLN